MTKNRKPAFTLVELLLVAAVIGIIQVVVIYTYLGAQKQSRDVKRKSDLNRIATALELYRTDKKEYPPTNFWISSTYNSPNDTLANTILRQKYIDSIPCDPKVTEWNCSHGGHNNGANPDFGYVYILKNYNFSGTYNSTFPGKNKYGLYATLEAPGKDDKNVVSRAADYEKAFLDYMNTKMHLNIMYILGN